MVIPIHCLYAAILGLIIIALGINVTVHRVKLKVSLGDGGNPEMLRMIGAPNAIEYIPLALLLMLSYEINAGCTARFTSLHRAESPDDYPDHGDGSTEVAGPPWFRSDADLALNRGASGVEFIEADVKRRQATLSDRFSPR